MDVTTQDRLAERYGRGPRRGTRMLMVYAGLVLIALIGWFVWILWDSFTPKVTSGLETWEATGPHSVSVTFMVDLRDDEAQPLCSVEAEDANEQKVGEMVDFEAEDGRQTVTFKTEREAARVEWGGCTAEGQDAAK